MSEKAFHPDPPRESVTAGHEMDRFRVRWLVILIGALIAFAVAMHAGLWVLQKARMRHVRDTDVPRSSVRDVSVPLDGPALQPSQSHASTPRQDLAAMYQAEDHVFSAMGWQVDPSTHRVHVPDAIVQQVAASATRRTTRPATRPQAAPSTSPVVTPVRGSDEGGPR